MVEFSENISSCFVFNWHFSPKTLTKKGLGKKIETKDVKFLDLNRNGKDPRDAKSSLKA